MKRRNFSTGKFGVDYLKCANFTFEVAMKSLTQE